METVVLIIIMLGLIIMFSRYMFKFIELSQSKQEEISELNLENLSLQLEIDRLKTEIKILEKKVYEKKLKKESHK